MSARDSLETDAPREVADVAAAVPSPRGEVLDDPDKRREAAADLRQQVEGGWEKVPFETPREELGRFDLKRAGLPDMTIEAAAAYVETNRASRPWLAMTDHASPEARRIIAAMDAAGSHAHIRHEGWVTEEANRRRVAYREDPAQLDPDKRHRAIDGLRESDRLHRCAGTASRITDPDAFATAYIRGVEHPKVREAQHMAFSPKDKPDAVRVPIADLLGPDGYRYCTGWRLEPIDGSTDTAYKNRNTWVVERAKPGTREPQAEPVPTFKDGAITFMFVGNATEKRYGITTMHPDPSNELQRES